jgi:carbonic anhydrase
MSNISTLFDNNRHWAQARVAEDPEFFQRLLAQQSPRFLWIGCADSRVPANEIVGLLPGELFVHRNVANVVVHTDLNCLSVLQYAVDVLRVEHVIVCGHYGCGGVAAACRAAPLGLIDNWLRHVQDVAERHRDQLRGLDEVSLTDRLCELNVREQALNVARSSIVQEAWHRGQPLAVHGWIYRLQDGRLREMGIDIHDNGELAALQSASPDGRG